MYTGIVDHIAKIIKIQVLDKGLCLTVASQFNGLQLGESIALDGICVTVTAFRDGEFDCELSPETLKLTTARNFQLETEVNLERSLTLQDKLGGHFVMGHVDTTATVKQIEKHADFTRVIIMGLTKDAMPYFAKKGSVCVNGVSLTINEVYDDGFEVMLIPHTQERTNLKYLQENSIVNIEFDTLARIVVRQFQLANYNIRASQ